MSVDDDNATVNTLSESKKMQFYVVSQQKFLILYIGTFGMYLVYWFFKHWSEYRNSTKASMWPIMRAIFSIFFTHSLFALFEKKYELKTGHAPKSVNYLATIYVIFAIGCQILSKLSENAIGNPITFYLSLLIMPVSGWIFYHVQSLANYGGEDVTGESNNALTSLNYLWLALGVIFWCLVLFGLFAKTINA